MKELERIKLEVSFKCSNSMQKYNKFKSTHRSDYF